jgi:hypothetical protein
MQDCLFSEAQLMSIRLVGPRIDGMLGPDTSLIVLAYLKVLAWPITTLVIIIVFREPIRDFIAKLQHIKLPGGAELNLQQSIQKAEAAAVKVASVTTGATLEQSAVAIATSAAQRSGLLRSPTNFDWSLYRSFARRDVKLALEGVRTELSLMLKNLVVLYDVDVERENASIDQLLIHLAGAGVLTSDQVQLVRSINDVIEAARCDASVMRSDAERTIDSAEAFRDAYLVLQSQKHV